MDELRHRLTTVVAPSGQRHGAGDDDAVRVSALRTSSVCCSRAFAERPSVVSSASSRRTASGTCCRTRGIWWASSAGRTNAVSIRRTVGRASWGSCRTTSSHQCRDAAGDLAKGLVPLVGEVPVVPSPALPQSVEGQFEQRQYGDGSPLRAGLVRVDRQDVGDDPVGQPLLEVCSHRFCGPGDDRVQVFLAQRGLHAHQAWSDGVQEVRGQSGQPGVEVVVAHDQEHRRDASDVTAAAISAGPHAVARVSARPATCATAAPRTGRLSAGHGCGRGTRRAAAPRRWRSHACEPAQSRNLERRQQIVFRAHGHGQPAVAVRQLSRGERGEDSRLDERGLARTGGPEERDRPAPARQCLNHALYGGFPPVEPCGVLRGEGLQFPIGAHIVQFQRGAHLAQRLGGRGVRDARPFR